MIMHLACRANIIKIYIFSLPFVYRYSYQLKLGFGLCVSVCPLINHKQLALKKYLFSFRSMNSSFSLHSKSIFLFYYQNKWTIFMCHFFRLKCSLVIIVVVVAVSVIENKFSLIIGISIFNKITFFTIEVKFDQNWINRWVDWFYFFVALVTGIKLRNYLLIGMFYFI